jgi:hypothetical protein
MTIDEAIMAIRSTWPAIPEISEPKLRSILERLVDAPKICGQRAWPYTENNVCVLKPHSSGRHKDAMDREFDVGGYPRSR